MNTNKLEQIIAGPPVAVAGMTAFGYPVSDWVQILALLWLIIQITHFLYTRWKK